VVPPSPQVSQLPERTLRRLALALALAPAVALLALERWVFGDLAGFPLDDPHIHLRFAERLAEGAGLSYQGTERVAATTAPLWTALLAALAPLPGTLAAWTKLTGLALHALALALVFPLARRLGLTPARAALATLLVGLSDGLVLLATSGMELPLFVALALAGFLRHLDERADPTLPPASFLLFGLAALARPEGLLLAPLAALDRALVVAPEGGGLCLDRAGLRRALAGLLLVALVVLPVAFAFHAFSGSPLPTTLAAKSSGPPAFQIAPRHLAIVFEILFAAQPLVVLLAAGGAVELVRRLGSPRDRGLLLPLWAVALPLASALLSSGREFLAGNFGRYFFPLFPVVVLLGLLALEPLRLARLAPRRPLRLLLGALALAALAAPPAERTRRAALLHLKARENVERTDGAAARWLAAHTPADALVAAVDVGLLARALPNPLLDLGGIVHPERQRVLARLRAERGLDWPMALRLWIEEKRPEYVVVFPRWWPLLERERARFPPLVRFRIPDNVAMAGDELVVYATPWTRSRTVPSNAPAAESAPREVPPP
jgi:hypothetical protein